MISRIRPRAGAHHGNMRAQRQCFVDAVRYENDRALVFLPDPDQFILHIHPGLLIERAERLIHQDDLRIHQQCAGDADALIHAASTVRTDNDFQIP